MTLFNKSQHFSTRARPQLLSLYGSVFQPFWFAAPLRSLKKFAVPYVVKFKKMAVILKSAAPLTPLCGTLLCLGTPVGNHCFRVDRCALV